MSRRVRRSEAGVGHDTTPEEDYRTAVLSDSPDEGVRYAPHRKTAGNDPDAKPACGTPRAGRSAAVVVSFLGVLRGPRDNVGPGGVGVRWGTRPSRTLSCERSERWLVRRGRGMIDAGARRRA